jgi:L,D-transpeptidase ErfK/SrfK
MRNRSAPAVKKVMATKSFAGWIVALAALIAALAAPSFARTWNEADFANRPLYAYPLPRGRDDIVGSLATYTLQPGDTLLDVGRWYGLSAKEISDANNHMDWWTPPVGKQIILPTEHILPRSPYVGLVMNIPEMRLYYYYPAPVAIRHRKGKVKSVALTHTQAQVVYTFPVGLGRFDWRTPISSWTITAKVKNPTWVLPQDIYEEHLERDGEAEHVVYGDDPDNPLGHYKLDLSIPEYGIHGTNVPWGVGMNVSHGCVRLYPEDIERLFHKVKVGTPGLFVYEPVKFGWRGGALYVEVHDDLYARYPGLWNHAVSEARSLGLGDQVDAQKLEQAVQARSGIPTYVMPGADPNAAVEKASAEPATAAPLTAAVTPVSIAPAAVAHVSAAENPAPANAARDNASSNNSGVSGDSGNPDTENGGEWDHGMPTHVVGGDGSVE